MIDTIIESFNIWTDAQGIKSKGRIKSIENISLEGVQRLRELIFELAVRGKLVSQDFNDEPASELIKRIEKEKNKLVKAQKLKNCKPLAKIDDAEISYRLPGNWEWVRLADICQINPRNDVDKNLMVGFVPMTLITTLHNGQHGQEERAWEEISQGFTHLANGDIGLAKITPCFENGKAAVFSNLKNGIGAGTTELHIARPLQGTVDPSYILICFKSPNYLKLGESKMTGTAGQKRVPKSFFAEHPLPLPPLNEQKRIVSKVNELIAFCDLLEQEKTNNLKTNQTLAAILLETLIDAIDADELKNSWVRLSSHFNTLFCTEDSVEQLREAILQLAMMGKLVKQNPADEPASKLIKKINEVRKQLIDDENLKTTANNSISHDEEYIGKPLGWEYCRLGNISKFIDYRGRTPNKTKSGVRLITAKNVKRGYISIQPEEFIADKEYNDWMTRGIPRVGDLLFTTEAPLGNVAIIDIEEKFALAQRVICLQLHDQRIQSFLKITIQSKIFQNIISEKATGMTATGIKASKLKEIPIPIPPLAEQERIVSKVNELFAVCDNLQTHINKSEEIKNLLAKAVIEKAIL